MDKISIQQLIETTRDLFLNLILRIDSIVEEVEHINGQEVFSNNRLNFILDDFVALAEAVDIIEKQNSSIYLEELTEKLNILYDSMITKDKLLFKDIIEFELKPLLEHWAKVIQFTGKH